MISVPYTLRTVFALVATGVTQGSSEQGQCLGSNRSRERFAPTRHHPWGALSGLFRLSRDSNVILQVKPPLFPSFVPNALRPQAFPRLGAQGSGRNT